MRFGSALVAAMAVLCPAGVHAQTAVYPAKAIRIVVPLAPGGNVDIVVRALAQQLSDGSGWQAIVDVIGGQVMLMFDQISTAEPQVKAGKLRGLAVTSLTRSPLLPNLPTVDESGAPGFEEITFNGLVAPAGTPREIRGRIHQEIMKAVAAPKLRDRFIERGVELKASAAPEEFAAYIKAEFDKKARLARDANIRID